MKPRKVSIDIESTTAASLVSIKARGGTYHCADGTIIEVEQVSAKVFQPAKDEPAETARKKRK